MAPRTVVQPEPQPAQPIEKKLKAVISTSVMFKKPVRPLPSKSAELKQKVTTTNKHQPFTTRVDKPTGISMLKTSTRVTKKKLEHPIAMAFNQTSEEYRSTVLTHAQEALDATHQSLLARLDAPNSTTQEDGNGNVNPDNRLPTTEELKHAHNATVFRVTAPLDDELLRYNDSKPGNGKTEHRLGDIMADFEEVVKHEEKKLQEARKSWQSTYDEIRILSEEILGKDATAALLKEDNTDGLVPENLMKAGGVDTQVLESLQQEITSIAEKNMEIADEWERAYVKQKNGKDKKLLNALREYVD